MRGLTNVHAVRRESNGINTEPCDSQPQCNIEHCATRTVEGGVYGSVRHADGDLCRLKTCNPRRIQWYQCRLTSCVDTKQWSEAGGGAYLLAMAALKLSRTEYASSSSSGSSSVKSYLLGGPQ